MPKIGLILYDIEMDGCLNGVFTNEGANPAGTIYNEVARKNMAETKSQFPDKTNLNAIEGVYDCFWFDLDNNPVNGTLVITENPARVLTFSWKSTHGDFTGDGYRMNERQIVVRYQSVP